MKKDLALTAFIFMITFSWWSMMSSCANIVPPSGGPADSFPPRLLKAEPRDSAVNVTAKKVTFTFDEYVDLQDLSNNMLYSPLFAKNPVITARGKTISVTFDSLHANTTYIVNFGNSIRDINEGNVLKNFVYAFSTGPYLDSLSISGKVLLAESGTIDSTVSVVLYRTNVDSLIKKQIPQYMTKVDGSGNFSFHHLPRDSFSVFVFGKGKFYDPSSLFAFNNSRILAGRADSLLLYAYREVPKTTTTTTSVALPGVRNANDRQRLRFTVNTNGNHDLQNDYVITFPVPLKTLDSSRIHLSTDSVYTPAPFRLQLDSSKKELRLVSAWKPNTKYNLVLEKEFATDTNNRQLLRADTVNFSTRKLSDYGKVSLRLKNVDLSKKPILQFVQNGQVVLSVAVPTGRFDSPLFLPGDYDLRILYDTNGNGKWDGGSFFTTPKRQPELAKPLDSKITVKADWDNEFDRSL